MKQSFTYSGEAKTKRDALKKAKRQGIKVFSDLVEGLLKEYAKTPDEVSLTGAAEFYAKQFGILQKL